MEGSVAVGHPVVAGRVFWYIGGLVYLQIGILILIFAYFLLNGFLLFVWSLDLFKYFCYNSLYDMGQGISSLREISFLRYEQAQILLY